MYTNQQTAILEYKGTKFLPTFRRFFSPPRYLRGVSSGLIALAMLFAASFLRPSMAGTWITTYVATASASNAVNGTTTTSSTQASSGAQGPQSYTAGPAQFSMNVTATLTWKPANSASPAADPPPATVYVLESASASVNWAPHGGGPVTSGMAVAFDDGIGDVQSISYTYGISQTCSGKHLVQTTVSNGTAVIPTRTLKVAASSSSGRTNWIAYMGGAYSVAIDTRAAQITSTLGTTYHNDGAGNRVADLPEPDGTVYANTAYPKTSSQPTCSIAFNGSAIGAWHSNSAYNMFSSIQSYDSLGTFSTAGSVTIFTNTYDYDNASPGTQEHVYLHLTDGSDSANATNNYYLTFHYNYEPQGVLSGYPVPGEQQIGDNRAVGIGPGDCAVNMPDSPADELPLNETVDAVAAIAAATGQEEFAGALELFSKIGAAADGWYHYSDEPPVATGSINNATTWQVGIYDDQAYAIAAFQHIPTGMATVPDGWMQCNMTIKRIAHYDVIGYAADMYGTDGFEGPNHQLVYYDFINDRDEPFFTVQGGSTY